MKDIHTISSAGARNGDSKSEIGIYKDGTWSPDYKGNGFWGAGIEKLDYFGTVTGKPVGGRWAESSIHITFF